MSDYMVVKNKIGGESLCLCIEFEMNQWCYNNNNNNAFYFMAPFKTPKVTSQANKMKNTSHCIKQKHTTNSVHIQVQCSRDNNTYHKKACIKRYVLRRVLKVSKQLLLRISRGREFHRRGAA